MSFSAGTAWKTVPISSVLAAAQTGFASGADVEDGILQIRMNNVATDGSFDWSKRRRVPIPARGVEKVLAHGGDILFNHTNSPELVGKSAFFSGLEEPVTFSNHFICLRPKQSTLDGRFLARWLQKHWSEGQFQALCKQWVNQATVSKETLLGLEVPLPPLEEQKRIAAILDQADELRRKRQRALDRLNQLGQAIFIEMFGDPVANPFGFPVRKLGELGDLDRGVSKHRPRNDPALLNGDHPLIQTGDVANADGYIRDFSSTYSDLGLRQSRKWPVGTLCITIAANIGKTAILEIEACFPDSVVGFTPNRATNAEYVQHWMERIQKRLEEIAPQSAQKNINLAILRELPIPVPPIETQNTFAKQVKILEAEKVKLRAAEGRFGRLFSSLQHRAFRGEL
jgi:type I restriction enzyme S subunit